MKQKTISSSYRAVIDEEADKLYKQGWEPLGPPVMHIPPPSSKWVVEKPVFIQSFVTYDHAEDSDEEPTSEWNGAYMSVTAELAEELKTLVGMLFHEGYNRHRLEDISEKLVRYDDLVEELGGTNAPKK